MKPKLTYYGGYWLCGHDGPLLARGSTPLRAFIAWLSLVRDVQT